jgi:hypothetical protein
MAVCTGKGHTVANGALCQLRSGTVAGRPVIGGLLGNPFMQHVRSIMIGMAAAITLAGPARALTIQPTFDSSLTGYVNGLAYEAAINTAVSTIDGLYGNPGTVNVLFEYNSGVLGMTQSAVTLVPYGTYTAQLGAISAANPANTALSTAVAHFGAGNIGSWVASTTALLRVGLGFTGAGTTPCFDVTGSFVSGCNATYDSIISLGNMSMLSYGPGLNSQAVAVVEHEINEVLGGGGPGSTIGRNFSGYVSGVVLGPTDLYRYQSATSDCAGLTHTPSLTTSSSAAACYSVDGGNTALVQMNQTGGGSDYGDFRTTAPQIQDAFYSGTSAVYSPASPEFTMMQSIGYNAPVVTITAAPEPSTLALLFSALGSLAWVHRRRA